jgi:hypothetical protein
MEPVHTKEIRLVSILILFAALVVAVGTAFPVQPGEILLPDATPYPDDLPEVAGYADDILLPDTIVHPDTIMPPRTLPEPEWILIPYTLAPGDILPTPLLNVILNIFQYLTLSGGFIVTGVPY